MAFLTPLFLAALAGLAIPVLLHLIQKERKNVVHFPSLMFLRRIPYQSVQRRRIRHWFLLLMRLAALALIVLAFARPFFRRQDLGAAASSGAREVVILLDRSYSMGYGDRWQWAVSAARDTVNGLRGQDRGSVVLFGSGAEVALRSTADKGRLQTALAGVETSASTTRYGPALKLAGSILGESALPRKEVILISDFQRSGWQGAEGVRLPDSAALTPVAITDAETTNMAVTPVALQRSMFENQERVTITAGVANHSDADSSVDLALDLGGRIIQTQRVSPAAHGSTSVTFEPVTVAEKNIRATVKLADDKLMRDNTFHFVLSPEPPVRIIIAERGGAARDTSLYLARALAVGEAPRFETSTRAADAMTVDDLNAASVIVLNDVTVTQATGERLQRFVERGGGLLVILGERASWPESDALLPGVPGVPVDRSSGVPARLGALEYGHPVFEIFRAPRTGDFSAARFYGYRAVTPVAGAQVLARFDDGGAALLERKVGNGRVLMFTSTVDLFWNDMALKPVYLPFLHRAVRHLAGYREPQPWRSVGEVVEPSSYTKARTAAELPRVVLTPKGERVTLDEEGPDVLELSEQGFYEVRPLNKEKEAGTAVVVASNVDLRESDLTAMDPQEVVAAALGHAGRVATGEPEAVPTDQAQEGAQRIWWYLLFAGLLLLGAETVVANRSTV
jgi:uncharacterized membrane protein